jgi:choline dehydrogenase-like flavoprotein
MGNFGSMVSKESYDIIVVGTGAGGATVAREMAKRKKTVLILEWGKNRPPSNSFLRALEEGMIPFKNYLITPQLLGMIRGTVTGGSTMFYYATAYPVQIEMFKKHGIDLTEDAKAVAADLPFVGPLKDHMITSKARSIWETAQDMGYNWNKLDKFIDQDKWTPDYKFGYWGDPRDIKWSALMWIREAMKDGATLLTEAKVTRVLLENKKAVGVEFKKDGRLIKAYASKIVLAAGGIGTPVILRATGIKEVGYDYFFDPLITVCGENKHLNTENEMPMQTGMNLSEEGLLFTDVVVGGWLVENMQAMQKLRVDQLFKGKHTVRIMVKMRDSLGGRLTDSGQVIKWLGEKERKKLDHGGEISRKILEKSGCKSIYKTWYMAAHPGGTVKLGEFVDTNLKMEYDNLHVCDCSVIPEELGIPPVRTLLTLGKYLAKVLTASLDKQSAQVEAIAGKEEQQKLT